MRIALVDQSFARMPGVHDSVPIAPRRRLSYLPCNGLDQRAVRTFLFVSVHSCPSSARSNRDAVVDRLVRGRQACHCREGFKRKVAGGLFVRVAILCSTIAFLDGFDSTSISVAAPLLALQFHILPTQLGVVFSSAVLGATLGAFSFGHLADRYGRKRLLIAATMVFGLFTFATAFAGSFAGVIVFRFLAGIGLGGATPCFIALATEFAPVCTP